MGIYMARYKGPDIVIPFHDEGIATWIGVILSVFCACVASSPVIPKYD